jgi:1,2-phenylacetyl-CoA epoxidase PaaB subunit
MSKRPSKRTSAPLYEWRIIRIKKTPAALVGYVNAPDKEEAIKKAIESFGVRDPQQQSPLSAIKIKEVPA